MKPNIRVLSALVLLSLSTLSAQAPAANGDFSVTLNLTPSCIFATNTLTLNYTSNQATDTTSTANFTATCTLNEVYHLSLATANGLTANGATNYDGTVLGLNYSLRLQVDGTTPITSATDRTGTGAAETLQVRGFIASGQGGTCAASDTFGDGATCATNTATQTIVASF